MHAVVYLLLLRVRCGEGLYSLSGGSSNGSVGFAVNYPCYGCPRGGMCTGGAVVATPQHWGAADDTGVVSFSACPTGYGQDVLNRVDVGGKLATWCIHWSDP